MFNKKFKLKNTALFNHINRNVVHPTVSLECSNQREVSTNVEIVELNYSSEECEERNNVENDVLGNAWSYIGHDVYTDEDSYRTNKSARDRRRLNIEADDGDFTNGTTYVNNRTSPDQMYPSFYRLDRDYSSYHEFKSYNKRLINCFPIPNKFGTPSSSSDDQNGDIEIIHCGDETTNRDYWNDNNESFSNEVYFSQNLQTDKRTIWIYSFKNKHTLSENDYVLTNIPSKDSSSCNSSTDELDYESMKESSSSRVATPIPYIPRLNLNLTLTLPTVTEVNEPAKQTSEAVAEINNTEQLNSSQRTPKYNLLNKENVPSASLRSKLINLTSLSPRKTVKSNNSLEENPIRERDQTYYEPEIRIITADHQIEHRSNRKPVYEGVDNNSDKFSLQEPHRIQTPKPIDKDPLEKLEGNWIGKDESYNEAPIVYEYDFTNDNTEQNSPTTTCDKMEEINNIFIRNMSLLETAESNESKPTSESPRSLSLNMITDVDTAKKSWFKKLFRCFKCFEKDK